MQQVDIDSHIWGRTPSGQEKKSAKYSTWKGRTGDLL
jgi:hypothetical protein